MRRAGPGVQLTRRGVPGSVRATDLALRPRGGPGSTARPTVSRSWCGPRSLLPPLPLQHSCVHEPTLMNPMRQVSDGQERFHGRERMPVLVKAGRRALGSQRRGLQAPQETGQPKEDTRHCTRLRSEDGQPEPAASAHLCLK